MGNAKSKAKKKEKEKRAKESDAKKKSSAAAPPPKKGVSVDPPSDDEGSPAQTREQDLPHRLSDASNTSRSSVASSDIGEDEVQYIRSARTKMTGKVDKRVSESGAKYVNQYKVVQRLGQGSYGKVKLALDTEHGRECAIKIIKKSALKRMSLGMRNNAMAMVKEEIAIMKKLAHENVVGLYEVIDDEDHDKIYLVQEFVKGGCVVTGEDLTTIKPLKSERVWEIFRDVVAGLEYLHSQGVVHGDVKPENLLVTDTGRVKICDFGMATVFEGSNDNLLSTKGTPAFFSPEICRGESYSGRASDWWALGITLFQLTFGSPPFLRENALEIYDAIKSDPLVFPKKPAASKELKDLLQKMLEKDKANRLSLKEIKEHPYTTKSGKFPMREVEYTRMEITEEEKQNAISISLATITKIKSKMREHLLKARQNISSRSMQSGSDRTLTPSPQPPSPLGSASPRSQSPARSPSPSLSESSARSPSPAPRRPSSRASTASNASASSQRRRASTASTSSRNSSSAATGKGRRTSSASTASKGRRTSSASTSSHKSSSAGAGDKGRRTSSASTSSRKSSSAGAGDKGRRTSSASTSSRKSSATAASDTGRRTSTASTASKGRRTSTASTSSRKSSATAASDKGRRTSSASTSSSGTATRAKARSSSASSTGSAKKPPRASPARSPSPATPGVRRASLTKPPRASSTSTRSPSPLTSGGRRGSLTKAKLAPSSGATSGAKRSSAATASGPSASPRAKAAAAAARRPLQPSPTPGGSEKPRSRRRSM